MVEAEERACVFNHRLDNNNNSGVIISSLCSRPNKEEDGRWCVDTYAH